MPNHKCMTILWTHAARHTIFHLRRAIFGAPCTARTNTKRCKRFLSLSCAHTSTSDTSDTPIFGTYTQVIRIKIIHLFLQFIRFALMNKMENKAIKVINDSAVEESTSARMDGRWTGTGWKLKAVTNEIYIYWHC